MYRAMSSLGFFLVAGASAVYLWNGSRAADRLAEAAAEVGVLFCTLVLVTGHTDRIGSQAYNQKLSERRANAVRDYLVSKGVARDKIETLGMGKTQPVPGVVCNQAYPKERKALIECLAPNRRVEVEVKGEGKR